MRAGSSTHTGETFFQAPPPRDREHLTQKPLDVMRSLCRVAGDGATILDPFTGSGTTGAAAVLNGQHFIGAEMSGHYAEVAAERLRTVQRGYRDDGQQVALDLLGDGVA